MSTEWVHVANVSADGAVTIMATLTREEIENLPLWLQGVSPGGSLWLGRPEVGKPKVAVDSKG